MQEHLFLHKSQIRCFSDNSQKNKIEISIIFHDNETITSQFLHFEGKPQRIPESISDQNLFSWFKS